MIEPSGFPALCPTYKLPFVHAGLAPAIPDTLSWRTRIARPSLPAVTHPASLPAVSSPNHSSISASAGWRFCSVVQAVFPGVSLPSGLEEELARVTQGNPLFLSEILRKLVMDRKVSLVGQQWRVEVLEEGYLPRSLEEIVSETALPQSLDDYGLTDPPHEVEVHLAGGKQAKLQVGDD